MFPTLEVQPALTGKPLEALCFQRLNECHGKLVTGSVKVMCEGKLKALFLKEDISQGSYVAALHALNLMNFNPASHSRRAAITQKATGGDLLLGWMGGRKPSWEDMFQGGHRDNFIASFWLVPLLKEFEQAMATHLPEYWQFHLTQAERLKRPRGERLKTLGAVENKYERKMLRDWDRKNRDYLFPGSQAFSTLTLNQSINFAAHRDGNNVPNTLSCLTALGAWSGGGLCFPRLGLTFDIRPRDLLISNTNTELHGNVGGIFGNRYSVVAYLHSTLLQK